MTVKDITVLDEPADNMMRTYLTNIVDRQFETRDSLLSTFKSARDWDMRATAIRDSMISWTGAFPERTPINARITGRIERDDYIIEKVLFESRPGFFVSANLYLPKHQISPCPAHLNLIGHTALGKADERYQRMSIAQVKNGFVVLTMDGYGQGERQVSEYAPRGSSPQISHEIIGRQAFISGTHLINFMVWDVIRAIDFLVSLPEVDADKICVTGSSGGGVMSTYILPFEDRIKVSVPTCNPNTWSYRVHANLATDHEQVFFGAFNSCIDPRGDPLFTHVPEPLLLNTTTDDNLNPPRGVWDLSTWLYKAYATHGVPEKFTTTMVRAGHAYNQEQREITYSWMLRWTGGDSDNFWEESTPIEKDENLWVTSSGNVFDESGSISAQDLVLDYLNKHKSGWSSIRTAGELEKHKAEMHELIPELLLIDPDHTPVQGMIKNESHLGEATIRSFIIEPEQGIVLPGILIEPGSNIDNQDIIVFISDKSKSDILNNMDIVWNLVKNGRSICAVDLRGYGETAPDMARHLWDFLAGKPIFGQRVSDILALVKWLKKSEINANSIKIWGTGMGALYSAFAGVLSEDITDLVLEEVLLTFESVVKVTKPEYGNEILLPGILEQFDMPQIYQSLSPKPVVVINPLSGDKTLSLKPDIDELNKSVLTAYRAMNKPKSWSVQTIHTKDRNQVLKELLK